MQESGLPKPQASGMHPVSAAEAAASQGPGTPTVTASERETKFSAKVIIDRIQAITRGNARNKREWFGKYEIALNDVLVAAGKLNDNPPLRELEAFLVLFDEAIKYAMEEGGAYHMEKISFTQSEIKEPEYKVHEHLRALYKETLLIVYKQEATQKLLAFEQRYEHRKLELQDAHRAHATAKARIVELEAQLASKDEVHQRELKEQATTHERAMQDQARDYDAKLAQKDRDLEAKDRQLQDKDRDHESAMRDAKADQRVKDVQVQAKVARLEERLESSNARVRALETELAEARAENKQLQATTTDQKVEMAATSRELKVIKGDRDRLLAEDSKVRQRLLTNLEETQAVMRGVSRHLQITDSPQSASPAAAASASSSPSSSKYVPITPSGQEDKYDATLKTLMGLPRYNLFMALRKVVLQNQHLLNGHRGSMHSHNGLATLTGACRQGMLLLFRSIKTTDHELAKGLQSQIEGLLTKAGNVSELGEGITVANLMDMLIAMSSSESSPMQIAETSVNGKVTPERLIKNFGSFAAKGTFVPQEGNLVAHFKAELKVLSSESSTASVSQ